MILLNNLTSTLSIVTSGATSVGGSVSWLDATGTIITTPAVPTNFSSSSAGTTVIVPSPGGSTSRNVKYVAIRNNDAAATNTITVEVFDGTLTEVQVTVALRPGYTLFYEDKAGWYTVDAVGGRQGIQGIPGTNGTNGTNAGNIGTATLNFGAFPGSNQASVVVGGQGTIVSNSAVDVFFMGDSTADHDANDHAFAGAKITLTAGTIVPGTGFTITGVCEDETVGTVAVRFNWN